MKTVTLNNNWIVQLSGRRQRKAFAIVSKAAEITGFDISDLRIGYTENGEPLYLDL